MNKIAVVNESTVPEVEKSIPDLLWALQKQVSVDLYPIWGVSGLLFPWRKGVFIPPGYWELVLADDSNQVGALGYHETTKNGDPIGFVFVKDDLKYGTSWTVTASHELLEMLCDPWINLAAELDNPDGSANMYAYEVCDACEDDSFGYPVPTPRGTNVLVSDFVTPAWFQPGRYNVAFDVQGHVKSPLQILRNGYISVLKTGVGAGWVQLTGEITRPDLYSRVEPQPFHRRWRRRVGKHKWARSLR